MSKTIQKIIIALAVLATFAICTLFNFTDRASAIDAPSHTDYDAATLRVMIEYCYNPPEEDIILFAQMMYGECRGVKDWTLPDGRVISAEYQKACCCWCGINRRNTAGWGDTLKQVIVHSQFHGYSKNNPVWDELYDLARDVLIRSRLEGIGVPDVGRVLPPEYTYFCSDGHGHNVFRTTWRSGDPACVKYDWTMRSPYEN